MTHRATFLLIGVVLTWVFALNSGRDLIFNLAYLLTAVLVLSYVWAWTSIRSIRINRFTQARRSQVGNYFEETLEVKNQGRLPKLWLEIRDFSTVPFHEVSQVINSLRGRSSYSWKVRTLCQQRGYYRLGPMRLESGDPLGLFSFRQEIERSNGLVVYPAVVDLQAFRPPIADLAGGEALRRRTHYLTTNVAGIREYAPGDSFNRIHWLSTARTGRLMTKEFELDPSADIWIFLDLFHGSKAEMSWKLSRPETSIFALSTARTRDKPLLPPSTTEYVVTLAASIARYFLLRNRAVGMIWHDRNRYLLQMDRGERQVRKILEALAVANAIGQVPFSHVLATEGVRLNRNNTILAISPDPNPAWARALREVRQRGVNSIAVTVNGQSFGNTRSNAELLQELRQASLPTYQVKRNDPIAEVLAQPAFQSYRGSHGKAN